MREAARLRQKQLDAVLRIQAGYRGYMDRKVSKAYAIERAAEVREICDYLCHTLRPLTSRCPFFVLQGGTTSTGARGVYQYTAFLARICGA